MPLRTAWAEGAAARGAPVAEARLRSAHGRDVVAIGFQSRLAIVDLGERTQVDLGAGSAGIAFDSGPPAAPVR